MSERLTKRDRYGHAYTNETIYDRGMTSKDGKTYEKHYFENGTSAYDGKPIDRLCELEDKIEQGKLVEVRHAHWVVCGAFDDFLKCSSCGYDRPWQTAIEHKYCPNCGARMDGERSTKDAT